MLKRVIVSELSRIVRSKGVYISLIIIILSSALTLERNMIYQNLRIFSPIGALNMFIYSSIKNNIGMSILAPLVAILPYSCSMFDDIKTGFIKNVLPYISSATYLRAKVILSFFSGGGIFVIGYSIWLLLMFILFPESSIRMGLGIGQFQCIYDFSIFLYCLFFMLYSFCCGACYALLATGISLYVKNKYLAIGLPVVLYYASFYIIQLLPHNLTKPLLYIIPFLTFEITTVDAPALQNIAQILFIYILASILIIVGYKRYRKEQ